MLKMINNIHVSGSLGSSKGAALEQREVSNGVAREQQWGSASRTYTAKMICIGQRGGSTGNPGAALEQKWGSFIDIVKI